MIDYDPHDWRSHLFDVAGSMVRQIFYRVLLCVVWSIGVVCFHRFVHPVAIFADGHVLIGVALGLLLVFRTNASYDRFWEGRKLWGSLINETRNLARAARVLLAGAPEIVVRLLHWTIAFPWATMHHLRGDKGLGPVADSLPAAEVKAALAADHVPLAVACRISEQLALAQQRGLISDYVQMQLDQNVQLFVDYLGACERIHKTPLPFAYVVHLRRALILYCFTLPFALLDHFGWSTILVTLFLTYTLFGIEEIGVEIEDPFGSDDNDLPLERFCGTIERNLREILATLPPDAATKSLPNAEQLR
jgi:putative membrane protein